MISLSNIYSNKIKFGFTVIDNQKQMNINKAETNFVASKCSECHASEFCIPVPDELLNITSNVVTSITEFPISTVKCLG